jgi:hypothetical protein
MESSERVFSWSASTSNFTDMPVVEFRDGGEQKNRFSRKFSSEADIYGIQTPHQRLVKEATIASYCKRA